MKIQTVNGVLSATAESLADIKKIMELETPVKAPVGRKGLAYKKPCIMCGKRVKLVKVHFKRMHPGIIAGQTGSEIRGELKDAGIEAKGW